MQTVPRVLDVTTGNTVEGNGSSPVSARTPPVCVCMTLREPSHVTNRRGAPGGAPRSIMCNFYAKSSLLPCAAK